jgi:hypothetical protein
MEAGKLRYSIVNQRFLRKPAQPFWPYCPAKLGGVSLVIPVTSRDPTTFR